METRTRRYMAALLAVSLSAAGLSAPVQAYVTHGRWASNKIVMRAFSLSFPPSTLIRTTLAGVANRYLNNPSNMWFELQYDDTVVGFNNGQSEVWFSNDRQYDPAWTFWYTDLRTGRINEADVVFYKGVPWTTYMLKTTLDAYGGPYRPFETTAIHEFGHAAGLLHESDVYNVMGDDWTHINCNGDICRGYIGADASDGLIALYGQASRGVFEDVGVSMFKWSGRSGGYSTHALCEVYTTTNGSAPSTAYNGQRRYDVTKGSTYQFEFTYENNGETTQTVRAGYYLSTNSVISSNDMLLATATFTLNRGRVSTLKKALTIPTSLITGGTYYIGVIIDDNNRLAETDIYNNAAYHIIKANPALYPVIPGVFY